MADTNTCPICGQSNLSDEQMTISENGNLVCTECADKED